MYIHGQHNRLFNNEGVEFKRVKCNFFYYYYVLNLKQQRTGRDSFYLFIVFSKSNRGTYVFFIEGHNFVHYC